MIDCITDAVAQGEKVQIVGFGTFEVRERGEKKCKNPRTGEECLIPASRVVKFTPGKALKEAVK